MRYYSLNQYLKETFGCKVYKLALSGGMTCPNRDGTLDTRGCIFCSASGSGEFAEHIFEPEDVQAQIESAKARVKRKIADGKYIAYFQAYTNTYAPVSYLERLYMQAFSHPDVAALSIATRPDCLSAPVLALLDRLNRIKPVWVELGLQTVKEESIRYIRRGYETAVYDEAVRSLKGIVSHIVTHVILGLPGESEEDMLQTVCHAAQAGTDGIKLQLLHVLKGTDLAADYEKGLFPVMSLPQYSDILCRCVEILPEHVVIHRLTGDGDKKLLLAPMWSGDKKRVLNTIQQTFETRDIRQGRWCLQ